MTLEKAVEILEDILIHVAPGDPPEEHDAVNLGIEALKELKLHRQFMHNSQFELLPGETSF